MEILKLIPNILRSMYCVCFYIIYKVMLNIYYTVIRDMCN